MKTALLLHLCDHLALKMSFSDFSNENDLQNDYSSNLSQEIHMYKDLLKDIIPIP